MHWQENNTTDKEHSETEREVLEIWRMIIER